MILTCQALFVSSNAVLFFPVRSVKNGLWKATPLKKFLMIFPTSCLFGWKSFFFFSLPSIGVQCCLKVYAMLCLFSYSDKFPLSYAALRPFLAMMLHILIYFKISKTTITFDQDQEVAERRSRTASISSVSAFVSSHFLRNYINLYRKKNSGLCAIWTANQIPVPQGLCRVLCVSQSPVKAALLGPWFVPEAPIVKTTVQWKKISN